MSSGPRFHRNQALAAHGAHAGPRRCPICSATPARPSSSNMAATPWSMTSSPRVFARDIVLIKQVGINPDRRPWRRPADRRDAGPAADQEQLRRRAARHRRGHRRGGRDGAGGQDQQADRLGHQPRPAATRSGLSGKDAGLMLAEPRADDQERPDHRSGLRRRAGGRSMPMCCAAWPRPDFIPGDRADRLWPRRRDLQHQCRHGGGRGRRRGRGDAPADADRRAPACSTRTAIC